MKHLIRLSVAGAATLALAAVAAAAVALEESRRLWPIDPERDNW